MRKKMKVKTGGSKVVEKTDDKAAKSSKKSKTTEKVKANVS